MTQPTIESEPATRPGELRLAALGASNDGPLHALLLLHRTPLLSGRERIQPELGLAAVFEQIHQQALRREQTPHEQYRPNGTGGPSHAILCQTSRLPGTAP
jgi:hypothetical protein